jgi:hypothetical protein
VQIERVEKKEISFGRGRPGELEWFRRRAFGHIKKDKAGFGPWQGTWNGDWGMITTGAESVVVAWPSIRAWMIWMMGC